MIFLDTETCGLNGPIVLMQYAKDDGPISIYDVWLQPVRKTLSLIEEIVNSDVVGFNMSFDWYHLVKMYHQLIDQPLDSPPSIEHALPRKPISQSFCLKPKGILDLWLHAISGPFQMAMERKQVTVRKVPRECAQELIALLETIPLHPILFARRKIQGPKWKVREIGSPDLVELYLMFKPGTGLKILAKHILNKTDIVSYHDSLNIHYPPEKLYSPYLCDWQPYIESHIKGWQTDANARQYAYNDIVYTRELYHHLGCPTINDVNSQLSALVASVRYQGYSVDLPRLGKLIELKHQEMKLAPIAPNEVKTYLKQGLSPMAAMSIKSTNKKFLEETAKLDDVACSFCGTEGCEWCDGKGIVPNILKDKAKKVIQARKAKHEVQLYEKLLQAQMFHFSAKIVGALSNRMSGTDDLNGQGIDRGKEVRSCFTFNDDPNYVACAGDFDSFEVGIFDEFCKDPELHKALKSGKKIHAVLGAAWYQKDYESILGDKVLYTKAKSGVFLIMYGGGELKLADTLGISLDRAKEGINNMNVQMPEISNARNKVFKRFERLSQSRERGAVTINKESEQYVESMNGWKRYFDVEIMLIDNLFSFADKLPANFDKFTRQVKRRDRSQLACNALRTALFAAAFNVQEKMKKAAANHVIQSTGACITKELQIAIWQHQPVGIGRWIVQPCNVHDEIICVVRKDHQDKVKETVNNFVERKKSLIPLIEMEWKEIKTWAEK